MGIEKRIILDFESRSMVELKEAGAYKYSLDKTTRPTCLAWMRSGEKKVHFFDFFAINKTFRAQSIEFQSLWQKMIHAGTLFVGHNVFFEVCLYKNILVARYGWPDIPFRQWRCTAAQAAACALPRSLENAGAALNLTTQKDKRGYSAMMATCKPTKAYRDYIQAHADLNAGVKIGPKKLALTKLKFPPSVFLEPTHAPEVWKTLYHYCKIDVLTEDLLLRSLPELIPLEQEVWFLNQQINWRGVRVDVPNAIKIENYLTADTKTKLTELDSLTMGLVTKPGARQAIMDFLALEGVELPNMQKNTVVEILGREDLSEDMRRLLELRQALSKTSTKKYGSFIKRAGVDHRVRDILLYHGASTGRDTGTGGVQLHNLPRPLIEREDITDIFEMLDKDDPSTLEWIRFFYGELGVVFSSMLRGMLLPTKDFELFVADFAKVEVAILWWLADNLPGLAILNAKQDPYIFTAMENTGKKYAEIDGDERQLGKAQTLGCGFHMGPDRFRETAKKQYGLTLTLKQSKEAVENYRKMYPAVPQLWADYENAAIEAVETKKEVLAGKCKFALSNKFLWVELPSGRKLAYREPRIVWRTRQYEITEVDKKTGKEKKVTKISPPKKTLEFMAVNSLSKKWGIERTFGGALTENITQAVARDLMMAAALRLEKAGYRLLLTVHDEAICERKKGDGSLNEFKAVMCGRPKWADEKLPIEADAWSGTRYRK